MITHGTLGTDLGDRGSEMWVYFLRYIQLTHTAQDSCQCFELPTQGWFLIYLMIYIRKLFGGPSLTLKLWVNKQGRECTGRLHWLKRPSSHFVKEKIVTREGLRLVQSHAVGPLTPRT